MYEQLNLSNPTFTGKDIESEQGYELHSAKSIDKW